MRSMVELMRAPAEGDTEAEPPDGGETDPDLSDKSDKSDKSDESDQTESQP